MSMKIIRAGLVLGLLLASGKVSAADHPPKQIGKFGDWTAFVVTQQGKKACYMVGVPKKSEGNYKKRGDVHALITHRPAQKSFSVVSFHAGYPFAVGAKAHITIDKQKFTLFTENETAWAYNEMDTALTTAMTQGQDLVVTGASARGTSTKDTYSLRGTSRALKAINQACGVK